MASALCVTRMCVPVLWCVYATSVTMAHTKEGVRYVEGLEYQMLITARNAPFVKKM